MPSTMLATVSILIFRRSQVTFCCKRCPEVLEKNVPHLGWSDKTEDAQLNLNFPNIVQGILIKIIHYLSEIQIGLGIYIFIF